MANIHLNGSGNANLIFGNNGRRDGKCVNLADPTMPKYVGARAEVTRVAEGVRIWLKDYMGETSEIIAEAIQSIVTNADGTLTFTLPDGRTIVTGSLKGDQGIQGEPGNGIVSIEKTATSGLVDTYTITFDDGDTTTFTVTNGSGGGADVESITNAELEEMLV